MIVIGNQTTVQINTMLVVNIGLNTANFTGTTKMFIGYDYGAITVSNALFYMTSPPQTQNTSMTMMSEEGSVSPTFGYCSLKMINTRFLSWDSFPVTLDATLPVATYGNIRVIDDYCYPAVFPLIKSSTIANPATSYILYGSMGREVIILFDAPIAALVNIALALNYTASGSGSTIVIPPGAQVRVVRASTCTGAFNITVRNATLAGSLLSTITTAGTTVSFVLNATTWPPVWAQL